QEYSEDSNSEPDVDLENQYYNSKALKEDDPNAALASFQKVLDLEGGEKGEWGFKALKQMIKINFKLGNYKEMMVRYKQLLTYIKSAVTRNHSEKSINSILDYISTSKNCLRETHPKYSQPDSNPNLSVIGNPVYRKMDAFYYPTPALVV
ncbi:unnamed protein product, partial [Timema podura]|nr:unnamed protein product [Timema podura]